MRRSDKKIKRIKSFLIGVLSIVLFVQGTFYIVQAANVTINVTKCAQEKSKWCWAACAEMVGKYYGHSFSQKNICKHVKGQVIDEAATISEITSALGYTTSHTVNSTGVLSFSGLSKAIYAGSPRVIRIGWTSGNGHVYVLAGIREETGGQTAGLYLIDPIAGHGNAYYAYTKLVNGTNLAAGHGSYTNTWIIR